MDLNLKGKRAVVCGATQGIGLACAEELARLGASITLVARNGERLKAIRQQLFAVSGQVHQCIVADFSQPMELQKEMSEWLEAGHRAEILVNNTGGPAGGKAIDAGLDAYTNAFQQLLICNQLLAQLLVPHMKETGFGRIINIISTSVKSPIPGLGVSNTIRGAVANWAKTLSSELGAFGITVNNVLPGATETGRLTSIIENKAKNTDTSAEKISEQMKSEIPAQRFASPEELAYAVAFLASPSASYINGINLPVDGGRTPSL